MWGRKDSALAANSVRHPMWLGRLLAQFTVSLETPVLRGPLVAGRWARPWRTSVRRAAGVVHSHAKRTAGLFSAPGEPDLAVANRRFHPTGPSFVRVHVKRPDR